MVQYEIALVAAGCIGCFTAIVHGVLMQKMMIRPLLANASYSQAIRRLLPVLLQFSTFCWFFGGAVLIATPILPNISVVLTSALFVGTFYIFGAIGNFWGTRGRHPGWVLLAIAVGLIMYAMITIIKSQTVV